MTGDPAGIRTGHARLPIITGQLGASMTFLHPYDLIDRTNRQIEPAPKTLYKTEKIPICAFRA